MSKVKLHLVRGNSYYMTGVFAVGVYRYQDNVILIDSGSDEQSASRVAAALKLENCTVRAIINTHCHPDHCGGNAYFQKIDPTIKVYAAYDEKIFIEDPKWAPRCFCAQAAPLKGLQNKYLAPLHASQVTDVIPYHDGIVVIDNQVMQIVTLSGHTPGSIGIITPDHVLYSGDALFGTATLSKHPILFYTDITETLQSLKKLQEISVQACVLYHGGMIENLAELSLLHQENIMATKDAILDIIQRYPMALDHITQRVMQQFHIPGNLISFTLTQTTIRAYLAFLEYEQQIQAVVQDGLLLFESIK